MVKLNKGSQLINFYDKTKSHKIENPNYGINNMMKLSFRLLIAGGSGSGKTNLLLNLLKAFNNTFDRVIICCKSTEEPLYQWLKNHNKGVEWHEDEIPRLKEIEADYEGMKQSEIPVSLIVFDDMVGDKEHNKEIAEYYKRARKLNMSCAYLSQSYYLTPNFIRKNLNYLMLMKSLLHRDLKMILSEFNIGITKDKLIEYYNIATENPLSNLLIDLYDSHPEHKRIASGLMNYF